jgi:tetratricopeptide (TPR) repeat protein
LDSARTAYGRLQQEEEAEARPPTFLGRLWLARLLLQEGEYHQSQEEILAAIQLAQESKRAYDELDFRLLYAYSELQLGRFPGVFEALKPTVEIFHRDPALKSTPKFALLLSGMAELGRGQVEEVKKTGQQLRELIEVTGCPKHLRYYDHLMGWVALAEKRPADAAGYFEQAISLLPAQRENSDGQAFFYDGLASAYYQGGDYAKAREAYQRIISLTTGRLRWGDIYALAFYWLGKISQKEGNVREASEHYGTFLKLWEKADRGIPEVADATAQLATLKKTL